MSDQWHVIDRAEASSLVENPSFEVNITDFWAQSQSGAGGAWARSTTITYYGIGAARITAGDDSVRLTSDNISLDDDETIYVQCRVRANGINIGSLAIRDITNGVTRVTATGPSATGAYEGLTTSWTNDLAGGAVNVQLWLVNTADDSASFTWFDAVAGFINVDSTYVDGDQPGCEWNGEAHNSTSTRSALSFDGGIDNEFAADLSFFVDREIGVSAAPVSNTFQSYAMTTGSFYNGSRRQGRPFTLSGLLQGSSKTDLHDKMKAMNDIFDTFGNGEVRLEYDGGTTPKFIKARYEAGLQGNYGASPVSQNIPLRFFAADPNFYQVNDTNDVLDVNDAVTLRYITRRRRSSGQWDDMGLAADPNTDGFVYVIFHASDGFVYIGGDWLGWEGNAGWDFGVRYDPFTDTFSRWGGASDFNERIRDITEGPDGLVYACGAFTNVGDANGDYIVSWNGAAWVSLGTPSAGAAVVVEIKRMGWDSNGYLYAVGEYVNLADVAAADGFAYWDGTNWATLGAPAVVGAEFLTSIAIDADDNIYVAGDCDNIGGVTYDNIAMWNGTAWVDVGIGLSNPVLIMKIMLNSKDVIIGGAFTNAGGNPNADFITLWNGQKYGSLGTPPDDTVTYIKISPNGNVYAAGVYTRIGGFIGINNRLAYWNGSTWVISDYGLWGSIYAIEFTNIDPITNDNFDIYLGGLLSASVQIAGSATVNNPGNADAYPTFIINRSGGTSAILYSIRNETTGKQIYMQPLILDGDTITIELSPNGSTVTSARPIGHDTYRYAILANSDDGTFVLIPGDNNITCFVDIAGAPTMVANSLHKAVFGGYDD